MCVCLFVGEKNNRLTSDVGKRYGNNFSIFPSSQATILREDEVKTYGKNRETFLAAW